MSEALQRQRNLGDECFISSLRFAEASVEIKQLSSLLVKVLGPNQRLGLAGLTLNNGVQSTSLSCYGFARLVTFSVTFWVENSPIF